MDASHVSLVSLRLNAEGFELYRCDKNISLGLNLVRIKKLCQNLVQTITRLSIENDIIYYIHR